MTESENMTGVIPPKKVVVGVDGSSSSTVAVRWAADAAHRRGCSLELIEAYQIPVGSAGPGAFLPTEMFEAPRLAAEEDLLRATAEARVRHPDLVITSTAGMDTPFHALRQALGQAELVVVGSHGQGLASETLLGSVAQKLISHSPTPVAVIRSDAHDHPTAPARADAPVLVGLDGSDASDAALAFAFEEARVRGVELVAVRCWDDEPLDGFLRVYPLEVDRADFDRREERLLRAQLGPWLDKDPSISVRPVVRRGRATKVLMQESATLEPALLVLGSRGRGGFAGLLLGSTGHEIVAYATCPVVIVHAPPTDASGS